ncbi:MAG: hypothetical protein QW520_04895 [Methanomassiliicoccales archaeon]
MKCDRCDWVGSKEELVVEEREKTLLDSVALVFFAYSRKRRFYCPKCHRMLYSEFMDGPLAGY